MRRVLLLLILLAGGCGGGDAAEPETSAQPTVGLTPTEIQTVKVPDTAQPDPEPSGDPAFTIELTGQSGTARAGEAWRFTVKATDADGGPASGTAKMRVFVDDELVDTIGWFPFDGTLTKTHRWPRSLSGEEVVLQAEVEGAGGTRRENFSVRIS